MGQIDVRRVYDVTKSSATPRDTPVYLIDGVWPRGVRKDDLQVTAWLRELAPSKELRQWFGHRADRFDEFRRSYRAELDAAGPTLDSLVEAVREGPVTLLYAARDRDHNNAVVLREYVEERISE